MRRRFSDKRPSPATAISIVALVFAVAGTAVAGVATVSVLSKKEKRQARNIAKAEVRSSATGQQPSQDTIELVPVEDDGWRVSSLG